jgi:hypothetical protein
VGRPRVGPPRAPPAIFAVAAKPRKYPQTVAEKSAALKIESANKIRQPMPTPHHDGLDSMQTDGTYAPGSQLPQLSASRHVDAIANGQARRKAAADALAAMVSRPSQPEPEAETPKQRAAQALRHLMRGTSPAQAATGAGYNPGVTLTTTEDK